MKAIVYANYGPPNTVALAEVPTPSPRDRELLIRIHATTVTTADWRARSLKLPAGFGLLGRLVFGVFGPNKPILGTELAGEVEAVGHAVTRFKVGDRVDLLTAFLVPELSQMIHGYVVIPCAVAEIWMVLYLLVVGVRTVKLDTRNLAAA